MRKIILMLTLALAAFTAQAQDKQHHAKRQELGVYLNGFDHDGYFLRIGKGHSLWRLSLYEAAFETGAEIIPDSVGRRGTGTDFAIGIGREARQDIGNTFCFRTGWEVRMAQSTSTHRPIPVRPNYLAYTLELNAILGVGWAPSDRFLIGVEVQPGIIARGKVELFPAATSYEVDFDYGGVHISVPNRLLGSVAIRL